jgi:hypothetical protein
VLLDGLEPSLLAPEANALSAELQEREADFTIKYKTLMVCNPSGSCWSRLGFRSQLRKFSPVALDDSAITALIAHFH